MFTKTKKKSLNHISKWILHSWNFSSDSGTLDIYLDILLYFFNSTDAYAHAYVHTFSSIHACTHSHAIHISIFERLSWHIILRLTKSPQTSLFDGNVSSHWIYIAGRPGVNSEKCKHQYQVWDLNSGGQGIPPYPYEHLQETESTYHLEIYEVTVGASSSTGTFPPTKNASPEILK